MRLLLSDKLLYLSRDEWDISGRPRLGQILNNAEATEAIQHHTVGADDDGSPNLWTTIEEVIDRMRFLRTIRPDLGEDIPYSWVGFFMEIPVFGPGGMVVCEGRGPDRRGAHTRWHNRTGRALAIAGNFHDRSTDVEPFIPQMTRFWSYAAYEQNLPNLGTRKPRLGVINPHREFPTASTVCPGDHMVKVLHRVQILEPVEEEDMTTYELLFQPTPFPLTWIVAFVEKVPIYKRYIAFADTVEHLANKLGAPKATSEEHMKWVPKIG